MNALMLGKGLSRALAVLAVVSLAACGTATVVKPSGGSSGSSASTTPRTSVAKPGQTLRLYPGGTVASRPATGSSGSAAASGFICWQR